MSGPREFLLANLPLIEQIIAAICRRKGMTPDEIEEFAAAFNLHLVENDYAVIRAYAERSSFATYIAAVISRRLIDHWIRERGRWRPSAEAERLGEVAVNIERLLHRDERTPDEAFAAITPQHELSRAEFDTIAQKLPVRFKRRRVDLEDAVLEARQPDVAAAEIADTASTISRIVCAFIDDLPEDDQRLLRMRFDADMSVAQIARALHADQQSLYRRLYRRFGELRTALKSAGIDALQVAEIVGKETDLLDFRFKTRGSRPSALDGSTVASRQEEKPS